jgi:hypothetical protein
MSQKLNDEYNWENYTKEYSGQLKQIEKDDNQTFFITDYEEKEGEIVFKDPLHPNWKEIYAAAYDLKPESIFECGFGGCYHLKNLHKILPDTKISGCDLLQTQMDFGVEFSDVPDSIKENMKIMDFTQNSLKYDVGKHEFVYSQAVVMHLNTERAKRFLKNMGKISSKYIVLSEGYKNHKDFFGMIRECLPEFELTALHKHLPNCLELEKKGVDSFTCGVLLTRK